MSRFSGLSVFLETRSTSDGVTGRRPGTSGGNRTSEAHGEWHSRGGRVATEMEPPPCRIVQTDEVVVEYEKVEDIAKHNREDHRIGRAL